MGVAYSQAVTDVLSSPNLTFAVLCERVLQEKDGVLSIMRIADRVTVTEPVGIDPGLVTVPLQMALGFRPSEPVEGELQLRVQDPSGGQTEPLKMGLLVRGAGEGTNVIIPLTLNRPQTGVYWIEVVFAKQLLARVPLSRKPDFLLLS